MALDKFVDSAALDAALTATADAIRTKGGTSAQIAFDAATGFKNAVDALPSGGGGVPSVIQPGNTPVTQVTSTARYSGTTPQKSLELTILKDGYYKFTCVVARSGTTGSAWNYQLYVNDVQVSTGGRSWSNHVSRYSFEAPCYAGDKVALYVNANSSSTYIYPLCMMGCIDWDNGFYPQ